jgi:RNA polymerase sigma factor (sigma-70 family)
MNKEKNVDIRNCDNRYFITNDEVLGLLESWRKSSGRRKLIIKDNMIEKLSYIIQSKIRPYKGRSFYEDLLQEGRIGLSNAIDQFNAKRGVNFFKFATWYVKNKIRAFIKKQKKFDKKEVLTGFIGGLGLQNNDLSTFITDSSLLYEQAEMSNLLLECVKRLPEVDRKMVTLRFGLEDNGLGQTYQQIGNAFSLSKQRIEQITSRALSKLRKDKYIRLFSDEV